MKEGDGLVRGAQHREAQPNNQPKTNHAKSFRLPIPGQTSEKSVSAASTSTQTTTTVTMSGTGPESIPVSADPRSRRPTKKRALSPTSAQKAQLETLLKRPDQEIRIPTGPPDPKKKLPLPPEIVTNVQGSSAGAGSGEFHVYKAARRREYERLRIMDEEVRKVEEDKDFHEKKEKLKEEDDAKTKRNREKREKMRLRKEKAKLDKKNGGKAVATQTSNGATGGGVKARVAQNKDGDEDTTDAGKMDVDPNDMVNTEATKTDTSGLIIHDDDD